MELSVVPRELLEEAIIEGNIYFFEKYSSFGVPGHMHVCVKRCDRLLFFSTCSSKIQTALSKSASYGWDLDTFPVYPANQNTNKFDAPLTYVNCNRCYDISVSDFVDLMKRGEVRLLKGNFSSDEMRFITNGILKSNQIPREVKEYFKTSK